MSVLIDNRTLRNQEIVEQMPHQFMRKGYNTMKLKIYLKIDISVPYRGNFSTFFLESEAYNKCKLWASNSRKTHMPVQSILEGYAEYSQC